MVDTSDRIGEGDQAEAAARRFAETVAMGWKALAELAAHMQREGLVCPVELKPSDLRMVRIRRLRIPPMSGPPIARPISDSMPRRPGDD
jgi:hypothetical protein